MNHVNTKSKWTNKALEEAMDVIENGTTSLKKVSRIQDIPFTSLFNHLYRKTRSRKLRRRGMLTLKEN
jgi:hypothetical protein